MKHWCAFSFFFSGRWHPLVTGIDTILLKMQLSYKCVVYDTSDLKYHESLYGIQILHLPSSVFIFRSCIGWFPKWITVSYWAYLSSSPISDLRVTFSQLQWTRRRRIVPSNFMRISYWGTGKRFKSAFTEEKPGGVQTSCALSGIS